MIENLLKFVSVHKLNCSSRQGDRCDCRFEQAKQELDILDKLLFALFEMRKYQILYFKHRLQGDLKISIQWELKVDKHYVDLKALGMVEDGVQEGLL